MAVVFFQTEAGNEPVRSWLQGLPKEERKAIGEDILTVQFAWPIGKPLVGSFGGGLWEVRSRLKGTIARTLSGSELPRPSATWLRERRSSAFRARSESGWRPP